MAQAKHNLFSPEQNDLAKIAKALGHPARIAIIQFLLKANQCYCGDIVEELPLSQSTVSQHLKALKQAGLIQGMVEGPAICYCIDPTAWKAIRKVFFPLFEQLKDCC